MTTAYKNGTSTQTQAMPHNIDAEMAVLGGIFIDDDAYYEVAPFLRAEHFYVAKHREIYKAMAALAKANVGIDYVTLAEVLRGRDVADADTYLLTLAAQVPSTYSTKHYGRIVEALAVRRRMIHAAGRIATDAYDTSTNINDVIELAERQLFEATENASIKDVQNAREGMMHLLEVTQERYATGGQAPGLMTGFTDLDRLLDGMDAGNLYVLAGRPGMGKTALALSIALNVARRGKSVANFNLEMPALQVWQRLAALNLRFDFQKIRKGDMTEREWREFAEVVGSISELSMFVDDTPQLTPTQLSAKCRRIYAEHGLDLVTVDHLQLMNPGKSYGNRNQDVGEISRSLKTLAKSLDVPVLALAQLNRSVESRADKHPQLSDLRDSGEIEQDADAVLFLYRDEYYTKELCDTPNQVDLEVAKHRNGPNGMVTLYFDKKAIRFADLAKATIEL